MSVVTCRATLIVLVFVIAYDSVAFKSRAWAASSQILGANQDPSPGHSRVTHSRKQAAMTGHL